MSYCALSKVDDEKIISRQNCFTDFYTSSKNFKSVSIYALDNYQMFKGSNKLQFDDNQIKKYLDSFLEMGFKFEYSKVEKISFDGLSSSGWELKILTEQNSAISNMILTNAFRYMYELPFQQIVNHYLTLLDDDRKDVSNWNKFLICHYSDYYWEAHSIFYRFDNIFKMLSDEEFQSSVINQKNIATSTQGLKKTNQAIENAKKTIISDFERNIKNVYSYFDFTHLKK